jgi:hypothetical protein
MALIVWERDADIKVMEGIWGWISVVSVACNVAAFVAFVYAALWGKEDPRFQDEKLVYRS